MKQYLIMIGGHPGSGKTFIGQMLAREVGLLIDKDGITRPFTEAILETLTGNRNDRESDTYLSIVRPLEYRTVLDVAVDNLMLKKSAVCAAPYLDEFIDPSWRRMIAHRTCGRNAIPIFVWVQVSKETARERIEARQAGRDEWKIANWSEYCQTASHEIPQGIENLVVIQNDPYPTLPLHEQIESLVRVVKEGKSAAIAAHLAADALAKAATA